jgi:hypothetical protein
MTAGPSYVTGTGRLAARIRHYGAIVVAYHRPQIRSLAAVRSEDRFRQKIVKPSLLLA